MTTEHAVLTKMKNSVIGLHEVQEVSHEKGLLVIRLSKYFLLIDLLLFCCCGCALMRSGIASLRSTSDFMALQSDPRVRYEAGAENVARIVSENLDRSIQTIESKQYLPFAEPIEIIVCAKDETYWQHAGQKSKAVQMGGQIWLSGMFKDDPQSIPLYLVHELSHLQLYQRIGRYHYLPDIPPWFEEGLAVMVSDGGGADNVSEAEAARAILRGKHFTPDVQGSLFRRKYGSAYGLEPHMFYRQSSMFVQYLERHDSAGFKTFLLSLQERNGFEQSFTLAFRMTIAEAWQKFVSELAGLYRDKT